MSRMSLLNSLKQILKSMLSVTQITAPIAVKSVVKLSAEARVSTIFPWFLMIIDQPLVDKVDTLSLVANWMSIKTFIPVRNHTNATSVDMQRQLVVICQNIKKKNIQIFKNLITFSNNCIFQNFTLLNKKKRIFHCFLKNCFISERLRLRNEIAYKLRNYRFCVNFVKWRRSKKFQKIDYIFRYRITTLRSSFKLFLYCLTSQFDWKFSTFYFTLKKKRVSRGQFKKNEFKRSPRKGTSMS